MGCTPAIVSTGGGVGGGGVLVVGRGAEVVQLGLDVGGGGVVKGAGDADPDLMTSAE